MVDKVAKLNKEIMGQTLYNRTGRKFICKFMETDFSRTIDYCTIENFNVGEVYDECLFDFFGQNLTQHDGIDDETLLLHNGITMLYVNKDHFDLVALNNQIFLS